jgi:parallel beta-helix repeat protein
MKMKRIFFSPMLFITLVSVLLFATFAHAATLEVGAGKPWTTIQSAINAAGTGDKILVYNGTYVENINFIGKAITVKSVNGAASTTIDGSAGESVVTFAYGEGPGSVLDGFTIKNGYGSDGGGIYCSSSSPVITNCTITGNTADRAGGGIYCSASSPTITNCTITGNTAYWSCGGIACFYSSSPVITNCTITGNTAYIGGGIDCYTSSSPTITNCTITGNTANYDGGGIDCGTSSSPVITNCTITGNTSQYGGGITCFYSSSPVITNCTITGNTAYIGGGIYCVESSLTVKNSILWGDTADFGGNEIFLDSSTFTVIYSDVAGGWAGAGNINADPLFVGNGDYHLKAGSPCINKGTSEGAPSNDIDGDTRPQGNGYDIGADEFVGYSISGTVTLNSSGLNGVTITLSGTSSGSTITDDSGNYSFTVSNGTYTVTPNKTGYTFNPTNKQVTVNRANQPGIDFTAIACTYTISPTSQSFGSSGGTGSVDIIVPSSSSCTWTANSNASWITIDSGSSGTGNGTVNYSVSANETTSQRTGTITIAGETFTVTQEGECSTWADVIAKYQAYVSSQASWNDVIECYNQYVSP